ncbi:AtpZ/AtpI family protein [Benzoatithermus flavus]|uniref:AtpZ/AtpI family protein n=1 Tax=Benzoatithermus flavus TaxID=3108223 RepID=A0ABU8XRY8_9PROT
MSGDWQGRPDGLAEAARRRRERARGSGGGPSLGRHLAQIGVLGWTIVTPLLLGAFIGRWLDRALGTGVFWAATLLFLGLALGCWSAWKRMQSP